MTRSRPRFGSSIALAACAFLACCTSFDTKTDPGRLEVTGPLSAYVSMNALEAHSQQLISADFLGSGEHAGELISFDLWPLFGVGAGSSGVRARLLPFEIALGTILDPPVPVSLPDEPEEAVAGSD